MTKLYLVRHALPQYQDTTDRHRALTPEGYRDSEEMSRELIDVSLDYAVSSPYARAVQTIERCAEGHNLLIYTDERLKERKSGPCGNNLEGFRRRWEDFDYCEEGGECLRDVQNRNIRAVSD